uniref:Uncharacterized protein n=1 Tax=Pleurozia purpurea TaxID=280637 RepID=D0R037_9MARC|nr:hypothetical protein PlpuMp38 [Pleurozia purpurea]ACR19374.1 hypothetical protein PlpuMp38 [Pleurozia purpurea]
MRNRIDLLMTINAFAIVLALRRNSFKLWLQHFLSSIAPKISILVYPLIGSTHQDFRRGWERKEIDFVAEQKAFMRFAYPTVDIYAMPWKGQQDLGGRGASTYNCSDNLGYIRGLNGKQKQLIKKLVYASNH